MTIEDIFLDGLRACQVAPLDPVVSGEFVAQDEKKEER